MLLEKNNLQYLLDALGTVSEHSGIFYIYTDLLIQTLEKLYSTGFKSLTDCFITKERYIYFQLTNFANNRTVFVISKQCIKQINDIINIYHNYKSYEEEILLYIKECN